jgi:two-component system, cell cycle sensor histidine kinase and response regulator CckA
MEHTHEMSAPRTSHLPSATEPRPTRWDIAVRVAGVYLLLSLAWVWLTDLPVRTSTETFDVSSYLLSGTKGTFFVVCSAAVIFLLIRRSVRSMSQTLTLLRGVADGIDEAVYVKDRDGKYLFFNEAASRCVGKPVSDVLGRTDEEIFDAAGAAIIRERDRKVMESGLPTTDEETLTASGISRTYLASKAPYRNARGEILGVLGISRDITERIRIERDLRETRARSEQNLAQLQAVVSNLSDGVIIADTDGNLLDWNPAALRIHGFQNLEDVQRNLNSFVPSTTLSVPGGEPLSFEEWPIPRIIRGETLADCELVARQFDVGRERIISYSGSRIPASTSAAGTSERIVLTLHDVTERRRAEDALRQSERGFREMADAIRQSQTMLRIVLDTIPQGVFWTDRDGRIVGGNSVFLRSLGLSDSEAFPALPAGLPSDASRAFASILGAKCDEVMSADAASLRTVEPVETASEGTRWLEVNRIPLHDASGRVSGLLGSWEDVTARRMAEADAARILDELRESEERSRLAQEAGRVGIFDWDAVSGNSVWTPEQQAIYGIEPGQFSGRHEDWIGRVHPQDRARVAQAVERAVEAGQKTVETEYRIIRPDGDVRWISNRGRLTLDANGKMTRLIGTTVDLSDRKKLESQFQQAQKMEAVGRLAGGVAHDFNNLLTVINGYCDLLLMEKPRTDPDCESIVAIRDAGERAARLTQQLLAFSRKAIVEPKIVDLNELVAESTSLLRRLIGEDVSLVFVPDPALPRIRIDPGQIEQVVMNLVVNARDAMPTGGRLRIETTGVRISAGEFGGDPNQIEKLPEGRYARISVADTGCGMTDDVRAKIFEPFFTTKGVGQGTGLGLAVVHGVMEQCGGHVRVVSEVNVGTMFELFIPAAEATTQSDSSDIIRIASRGTETILLVEDEDAVRTIARLALQAQGYRVLIANGAADALKVASDYGKPLDLLLTDVVMPEMGGRQLAEQLRARQPGLQVLYMSGFTDDAVVQHGVAHATDAFLQKPFHPLGLARKVRSVFDGGRMKGSSHT